MTELQPPMNSADAMLCNKWDINLCDRTSTSCWNLIPCHHNYMLKILLIGYILEKLFAHKMTIAWPNMDYILCSTLTIMHNKYITTFANWSLLDKLNHVTCDVLSLLTIFWKLKNVHYKNSDIIAIVTLDWI